MAGDPVVPGLAFDLRPVQLADAAFILNLRSDPALNRFLQDGARTLDDQTRWMERRAGNPGDHYFIIQRKSDGGAEGTIALYGHTADEPRAEWGRWILRPGSLAAAESAYLIYRFGFEVLSLDYIYCRTNAANRKTVQFHDKSGITRQGTHRSTLIFQDRAQDCEAVEHGCHRPEWPERGARLRGMAEQVAALLQGGA